MPSQVPLSELGVDEDEAPRSSTRASKGSGSSSRSSSRSSSSSATSAKQEKELAGRLQECFDRIAESFYSRGDEELAQIIAEDAEVMAKGLVNLTRPFKAMRTPLLAAVAIVEPLLAFGHIGRVLLFRWAQRRERKAAERAGDVVDSTATEYAQWPNTAQTNG